MPANLLSRSETSSRAVASVAIGVMERALATAPMRAEGISREVFIGGEHGRGAGVQRVSGFAVVPRGHPIDRDLTTPKVSL